MTTEINVPDWKWSSEDVVDRACSLLAISGLQNFYGFAPVSSDPEKVWKSEMTFKFH